MSTFKFWRVSNILDSQVEGALDIACSLLQFSPETGEPPSIVSTLSDTAPPSNPPSLAFDGDPATFTKNKALYTGGKLGYFLGCEFSASVAITSIQVKPYYLTATPYPWAKVIVEASADGIVWLTQGQVVLSPPDELGVQAGAVVPVEQPSGDKHRYWRVIDVATVRFPDPSLAPYRDLSAAAELSFLNLQGIPSRNPRNGYAPSTVVGGAWLPAQAFDGNPMTAAHPNEGSTERWFLSYDFIYPVQVVALGVILRRDYYHEGSNWLSAVVEASDDNLVWKPVGKVFYSFPPVSDPYAAGSRPYKESYLFLFNNYGQLWLVPTLEKTALVDSQGFKFPFYESTSRLNLTLNKFIPSSSARPEVAKFLESQLGKGLEGYIRGFVYERVTPTSPKTPVKRRVYLYHQASGQMVATTWSNALGEYLFNLLEVGETYMIISVDHTGKWGLEGSAFKVARRSVSDGLSVQYPID